MTDTNSWNWYGNSGAMPIKSKYLAAPTAQPDVPPASGGTTTSNAGGTGATTDPNAGATGGGSQIADPTRLAAYNAGRAAALQLALAYDTIPNQQAAFVAAFEAEYASANETPQQGLALADFAGWRNGAYIDIQAAQAAQAAAAATAAAAAAGGT